MQSVMIDKISTYLSIFWICNFLPVHSVENTTDVAAKFHESKIVPDVVPVPPKHLCNITYPSGDTVNLGNELFPRRVRFKPKAKWDTEPNALYTLAMVDPDVPYRLDPKFGEWHHWLVGNIPGDDVDKGETLSEYIGAGPILISAFHRYVFLVYKQPGKVDYSKIERLNIVTTGSGRANFKIAQFAEKYHLGDPHAGNFFEARWDDFVPYLHRELGEEYRSTPSSREAKF